MDVGRKCRYYYPRLGSPEDVLYRLSYDPFRRSKSRPYGVGAVAHHQSNAFFAYLSQTGKVYRLSVYRRIVYLEVSGVEDHSGRRSYRQTDGVCDGMGRPNSFYLKIAQLNLIAGFYGSQVADHLVFLELVLHKPQRKSGSIYRKLDVFQRIWYGAYMVLVTMGYHHSHQFIPVFYHVAEIRDNYVDSVHFVFRESHAAVYD